MVTNEQLFAVSPLDGRYGAVIDALRPITSEFGLMHYRTRVELSWLGILGSGVLPDAAPLSDQSQAELVAIGNDFTTTDAQRIKQIEGETKHDVKAVELWLREKLADNLESAEYLPLIHFGCTSEDINNLAYALMVRDARDIVLGPGITAVADDLFGKANEYAEIPMLARTHGQPATPTTLGKEMVVSAERLKRHRAALGEVAILGKWNGATGNYNAASIAYPEVDWPTISRNFVESLGLTWNGTTTQIESHDWLARFFNELALGNTIMTDVARDMWAYISLGYFKLQVVEGEVGSSTMPHKVNPIDFENAEANFGVANATLVHLGQKLPISRLQRDLSDSSALRAIGEGFGHSLVGVNSLKRGLGKVAANRVKIAEDIDNAWEVLGEAVQTVMRRYGVPSVYETIKSATRGRALDEAGYHTLVKSLDGIPAEVRESLLNLTPATYIGRATELARGHRDLT